LSLLFSKKTIAGQGFVSLCFQRIIQEKSLIYHGRGAPAVPPVSGGTISRMTKEKKQGFSLGFSPLKNNVFQP